MPEESAVLPRRTLLVEDDERIRRLIEKLLLARGHSVISCADGLAGWAAWEAERPELLVLDWMLPGMSGIEICQKVRQQPDGDLPTILIETARQEPEDLEQALAAGADDYVFMPLKMKILQIRLTIAEALVREKKHRRQAVAALQASEELYRSLVEAVPDTVYKLDAQGRFTFLSPAVRQLGYHPEDLIGRPFQEILMPDEKAEASRQAVLPQWAGKVTGAIGAPKLFDERRTGTRMTRNLEVHLRPAPEQAGLRLVAEINACGFNDLVATESGAPQGTIGTIRDVTLRKQDELALVHAERMAAVGTITGGIAHEFNNLHAVSLGYLELALGAEGLPADVQKWLDTSAMATRQASDVTRSLLTLCGKQPILRKPASLRLVVENALTMVRREFESEGIQIRQQLAEVTPFPMDGVQISQVVMNLLINARHAMLQADPRLLTIECGQMEQRAFVCVTDSGHGIAEEEMRRIFTPFYTTKGERAEGANPQPGIKGIGLGLTISRRIIEDHGGRITAEAAPKRGASFTAWLPIPESNPTAETPAAPAEPAGRVQGRILILEDEPELRALFAEFLRRAGLSVECAEDGNWAMRLLAERPFDLVLLDLQMPRISGFQFLEMLRQSDIPAKPRCLIMTGKLLTEIPPAEGLDIAGVLSKPFHSALLLEQIRTALQR